MRKSREFEKDNEGKDTKAGTPAPMKHAVPRLAPFAWCDPSGYFYDRPRQEPIRFDKADALKAHAKKDIKKNPLNWKTDLLTR